MFLYYITDRTQFPGDENARRRVLLRKIAEAARWGVDFIQLREKDLSTHDLEALAHDAMKVIREESRARTEDLRTRLLINSRTDVAMACGADGVHLRSDDIAVREVRGMWRSAAVVSVACHSVADVASAAADGADFAVVAPVFEKKDVANTRVLGLDGLREACGNNIPVLALGGIMRENARMCMEAGAVGIAAIRMFQENDIAEVVRRLRE